MSRDIKRIICTNNYCPIFKRCPTANSENIEFNLKVEYKRLKYSKVNGSVLCRYSKYNYVLDPWPIRQRIKMIGG